MSPNGTASVIFKLRGLLWGIFGLCVLVFPVAPSAQRAFFAAPLLLGGQSLRFWAAGVIPKYRTLKVGAPRLVTWGPYGMVRNPLYAGNALMGFGWSLLAGWPWVAAFAVAFFFLYCLVIIPYEEAFLMGEFRDDYMAYRVTTPSLVPNLSGILRAARGGTEPFDRHASWSMERHSLFMNLAVTALVCFRLFVLDY
ncbi:MAG: isoprenylcysteine carboxylmethyltransferase family protein [Synergistaceae bacterium]|jgi:protein-S-isoprenylcysteine O-methyltransferase Ste14|nr:isoprenylcysteine carboxylmethyltransferase family protein [Synergistaceae bacterium]